MFELVLFCFVFSVVLMSVLSCLVFVFSCALSLCCLVMLLC